MDFNLQDNGSVCIVDGKQKYFNSRNLYYVIKLQQQKYRWFIEVKIEAVI